VSQRWPGSGGWAPLRLVRDRRSSCIDWLEPLKSKRCDPYLVWEDAKALPGYGVDALESEWVTVLVEWRDLSAANRAAADLKLALTHDAKATNARLVRAYRCQLRDTEKLMKLVNNEIVRFELEATRSLIDEATAQAAARAKPPGQSASTPSANGTVRDPVEDEKKAAREEVTRLATRHRPPEPLIGVIDDVLNFRSERWRAEGGGHVFRLLWDQSDSALSSADQSRVSERKAVGSPGGQSAAPGAAQPPPPKWQEFRPPPRDDPARGPQKPPAPQEPPQPRYGRGLAGASLDAALSDFATSVDYHDPYEYPRIGARASQRGEEPLPARVQPMRDWSHGVAVADLIAREAGCVQAGRMMFASLPLRSTEDTSGGALAGFVLDAIHHFLDAADGYPLIVNVSYGAHHGPHDGSSLFETGIKELLVHNKNLHLVLPAGNSHRLRIHQQAMLGPRQTLTIPLKVMPDDRTDSFVEMWCHTPGEWQVSVQPPSRLPAVQVRPGTAQVLATEPGPIAASGKVHGAVIFPRRVSQGDHGTMALLAIAPTSERVGRRIQNGGWRASAPDGIWTITIENLDTQTRCFHAWVLRDDAAPGGTRAARGVVTRQSYIADHCRIGDEGAMRADPRSTINGLATLDPSDPELGGRLFVVGAMRAQDGGLATYSAAGPVLRTAGGPFGPNIVVATDLSLNQPGRLVGESFGRGRRRLSGTSVAAALVSGQLFRHLSQGLHADSFCGMPVVETAGLSRPTVPEGSPAHASPDLRGAWSRVDFETSLSSHCSERELGRAR
jgi:hypothetical protein